MGQPESPTAEVTDIEGTVTKVHFGASPKWSAGKIRVGNREFAYAVNGLTVFNTVVTLRGKWIEDGKWGKQFKGEVVPAMPTTTFGVKEWLARNGAGIGAVKAQQLVDEFGNGVLNLCASDPEQVAIFAKVSIDAVRAVAEKWSQASLQVAAFAALVTMGLTPAQADKVYGRFKGSAPDVVRADPYCLMREVDGFGWKTADDLARKLGIPADSPLRYRAALLQAVIDAHGDGSTAMAESDATAKACDLCGLPPGAPESQFAPLVGECVKGGHLCRVPAGASFALALPAAHEWELSLWNVLAQSRQPNPHVPACETDAVADLYDRVGDKVLDDTQRAALRTVAANRLTLVTGSAGSGKTLVASAIRRMFTDLGVEVHLCAPTGKAARRLKDVIGADASTIHRLLGYNPGLDGGGAAGFEYHAKNQLPGGVLILDEVSMLANDLAYRVLSACGTNMAVVFIGDPNQLPPVGAGALLRDVIAHDLAPVVKLGTCHRQAGTLKRNCNAILAGELHPTAQDDPSNPWMTNTTLPDNAKILSGVRRLFTEHLLKWGFDPVADVQFLTAKHAGPLGTTFLNRYVQWLRQSAIGVALDEPKPDDDGKAKLLVGDRVIQTKNNYNLGLRGVMNGTQGVVIETDPCLVVRYPDEDVTYKRDVAGDVQLSYVVTPHKYQGSEIPCAVVILPNSHAFMQHRHWLYTACTRAQKCCVVLGDAKGARGAVTRVENDRRVTLLSVFAMHPEARPL